MLSATVNFRRLLCSNHYFLNYCFKENLKYIDLNRIFGNLETIKLSKILLNQYLFQELKNNSL